MTSIQHISVTDLKAIIKPETIILDTRKPEIFKQGHIPGAINVNADTLSDFMRDADVDQPVYVCCYTGVSSQSIVLHLKTQGFSKVYNVTGGYAAWEKLA